jgi:ABC-type sugar transport system substrate-binding protein
MKKISRRAFLAAAAACGAAAALTACGSSGSSSNTSTSSSGAAATGEKKTIYFVSLKVGGAAWSQAQKGFEDACAELGWDGYYVAPTTANDSSQMANLCETAITSGADAILGPLYDADVFGDIINRAHEQGMLVGTTNTFLGGIEDFNIGTDQVNQGTMQGETLINLVGDNPCNVVWMCMSIANASTMETYDAFVATLEGHDNIKVHGIEFDDNNPTTAADKMNNLWKADPTINAVVCMDSSGASMGVPNFIEENGLQDDFYSIGIDASADILNYVVTGALDCTLDQNFYSMGHDSVYLLKDMWDGKEVPLQTDSGMNLVTAENAVEYGAERGYEVTAVG